MEIDVGRLTNKYRATVLQLEVFALMAPEALG